MMLWVYASHLQWEESAGWIIDHRAKSEHEQEQKLPFTAYLHISPANSEPLSTLLFTVEAEIPEAHYSFIVFSLSL